MYLVYLLLGLLPQLIGVTPEEAIKVMTNFTVRDLLTFKDESLPCGRNVLLCVSYSDVTMTIWALITPTCIYVQC